MNRVKIFTDSTSDLSKDLLGKYNIGVVPLYVNIGNRTFKDGVELTTDELFALVEKTKTIPKTSAPSVGDFYEAFKPWIDDGYDIFYTGLSSELSSTIESVRLAAQEFDEGRVRISDSQNLSTGIGLLLLEAADAANEGKNVDEIKAKVDGLVPKVRSSFIIETLRFLHMGGRCTSIQYYASNMLKIRPQIIVKDGGMIVGSKYRGKRPSCLEQYFEDTVANGKQIDPKRIFITSPACEPEEVQKYKEGLASVVTDVENIYTTKAGTVIASHCGPGTIGILYIEK